MNKHIIIALVFSFFVVTFITSCDSSKEVKISVLSVGSAGENISIEKYNLLNLKADTITSEKFDSTGVAKIRLDLTNSTFAFINIKNLGVELYLEPGYDLKIKFDSLNNQVFFTGKGADANNYLAQTSAIFNAQERKGGKYFFQLSVEGFEDRLYDLQESLDKFHTAFCDSTEMPKEVKNLLQLNHSTRILLMKQNYMLVKQLDPDNVSYEFLKDVLQEIPMDKDILNFNMLSYGIVLHQHLDLDINNKIWNHHKELTKDDILFPKMVNDSIEKIELYTPEIREFLLAKNIDKQISNRGITPVLENLLVRYKEAYPSSAYLSKLQEKVDNWQAIASGRPAPDFTGSTIDGKQISLKDFNGKVVYIDVWATWCGPCVAEFPAYRELQKSFEQNDDVVFLYVSIDTNEKAWKNMILKENDALGIHIIQPSGEIREAYQIQGVPRYILVGRDGKIANPNASKPSSGKAVQEIKNILK